MSDSTDTHEEVRGYNVIAVEAWIATHVPAFQPPVRWTALLGGHSNLTFRITDCHGRHAVIRRPPTGELLPKAHDMHREWQLISALGPTAVPVPRALGFCSDTAITGAPFYLMGLIDGHPLYSAADTSRWVPFDNRRKVGFSFIDVLADLHSVDPDAVGLGQLGKRDSYIGRQLRAWYRSWTASVEPAQYDDPRAHSLRRYFQTHLPEQGPIRVVHGDYGLHNCLVGSDGAVAAVVDWELAALGDPLADLAYALNTWPDPSDDFPPRADSALAGPGFPTRTELRDRYSRRTGRDLSHLDYYIGFNRWKSACILHGVYARYTSGKKSSEGIAVDELRAGIDRELVLAEQAVARLGSAGQFSDQSLTAAGS